MTLNRLFYLLFTLFKLMLVSNIVLANTLENAEQLYAIGNYKDSARMARTINTAASYSLAAKATLAQATFIALEEEKYELLQQAIKDADAALNLDSTYIDAHLQIALALGSIADLKHPIIAYLKGYASEGKQHLDIALSIAPDDAWVNGILGIWHLQIVNHTSTSLAENLYDANLDDGLYHCQKAKQQGKNNLQILYGCAISLYEFNVDPYKKQACEILESIVETKPIDVTESYVVQQATIKLNEKSLRH
jgi:hypothetical protein